MFAEAVLLVIEFSRHVLLLEEHPALQENLDVFALVLALRGRMDLGLVWLIVLALILLLSAVRRAELLLIVVRSPHTSV